MNLKCHLNCFLLLVIKELKNVSDHDQIHDHHLLKIIHNVYLILIEKINKEMMIKG